MTGETKDRTAVVQRFQSGEVPLFLISLKAGGTALNLTAADTVIHYDPWWNPAVEAQATDRAHRIGQTKSVFVYKLIAQDTVEERMLQLQADKRVLAEHLYTQKSASPTALNVARPRNVVGAVMGIETELQAQVDAQLMEQGAFAPLDLLFNSGRLFYSDYEAWRRREIEVLDEVLMGDRANIVAEMERAVSYARSIGLVEQPQEFPAWGPSGATGACAACQQPTEVAQARGDSLSAGTECAADGSVF